MKPSALDLPRKFESFRSYPGFSQWDLCKQTALAFRSHRSVLWHIPPGAGKTLMAATVQKLIPSPSPGVEPRMLYLTPSRGLQDQLDNEFDSVKVVKGRSNYYCPEFRGGCDLPALTDSRCSIEHPSNNQVTRCPYRTAISNANQSPTPCGNYAFWFSLAKYGDPDALGDIDMLVCDEAHSILDTITSFAALVLSPEDCRTYLSLQLPRYKDTRAWAQWARDTAFKPACAAMNKVDSRTPPKTKAKVTILGRAITQLCQLGIDSADEYDQWIPDTRELDIKISPLWPCKLTESLLFRDIPRILLCSGTLTPDILTDLGIERDQAHFIEVGSACPPAHRPVIYLNSHPEIKVEYSMTVGEKRAIVKKIDSIIDIWGDYPGLILPTSYDWCSFIVENTRYPDLFIYPEKGRDHVTTAIELYRSQSSGILLSPALWEGYDFPDSMWAIFPKIPFIPKNPLLDARKKSRKGFANKLIAAKLLQGSMRHIRSHTAKGVTFILDWHWTHFQNSGAYFPSYYRSAWRVRDTILTPKELGLK